MSEVSRIRLVPTVGGRQDIVEIDGQDVASGLGAYTLRSKAGYMPILELELNVLETEVKGEARVVMTTGAREALIKLGWTPPEGSADV